MNVIVGWICALKIVLNGGKQFCVANSSVITITVVVVVVVVERYYSSHSPTLTSTHSLDVC